MGEISLQQKNSIKALCNKLDGIIPVTNAKCLFLANEKEQYLLDNEKEVTVRVKISTNCNIWSELTRACVSTYGGGEWRYYDDCFFSGDIRKSGSDYTLINVSDFVIFRHNMYHVVLPKPDINEFKVNLDEICVNYDKYIGKEIWLVGNLRFNDGVASLSDVNNKVNFSIDDIDEIIEENFIPGDEWPDYEALVKIKCCLNKNNDELLITSANEWILYYPFSIKKFHGTGVCEYLNSD